MHAKQVLSERLAALLREQISAPGYTDYAEVCACVSSGRVNFASPRVTDSKIREAAWAYSNEM